MKIQNWSEMTMDKEAWRIIAERRKSQRVVVPKGEEKFLEYNFHLLLPFPYICSERYVVKF